MASTPVQTSYRETMKPPAPGTISGSDFDTMTGNAQDASGNGIPFGRAVGEGNVGTHGDKATVIGGVIGGFKGISVRDIAAGAATDVYKDKTNMSILRRGQIWVEPREAVVANDAVYYVSATGILSNTASGAVGPIPGARWITSSVDGRAEVYIPGLQNNS